MIRLSNGYMIEYLAASGALGYDGRGWLHERLLSRFNWIELPNEMFRISKTLTLNYNRGNGKFFTIRPLRGGAANAMALPNPGLNWWCNKHGSGIQNNLIVSLHPKNPKELGQMAAAVRSYNLVALEFNPSCPNICSPENYKPRHLIECCAEAKKNCDLPLFIKLSVLHKPHLNEILPALRGMVEAININSVPWPIVFPGIKSPLRKFGGGAISGKLAQKFNWLFMKSLADKTNIPIIAPSIWEFDDIAKVRAMGAKAIAFGSIFLLHPGKPGKYIKKDRHI